MNAIMAGSTRTTTISAVEARKQFGQVLNRAYYGGESFIIRRAGKVMVRITPVSDEAEPQAEGMSPSELDALYAATRRVKGICKTPVSDASETIDELLYGENGAWRGSDRFLD